MAEELAIEVVASWVGNNLDTTLVTDQEALVIGPGTDAWLRLPSEVLAESHRLVERAEGGYVCAAPEGAELRVSRGSNKIETSERRVRLEPGTTVVVSLGGFSFFVRAGERAEAAPRGGFEWRWTQWLAAAAVLHGIFLGIFALMPPGASALNLEALREDPRYLSVSLNPPAQQPEPAQQPMNSDGGGGPSDANGRGGGNSTQVAESSSPAPRRNDGRRQPQRTLTRESVTSIGVLAELARDPMSFADGSSPYSAGNARDGEGGLGNARLLSMPGGTGFGPGMTGVGVGTCDARVRDCGLGMIGVDGLTTRDPGGHTGSIGTFRDPAHRVPPPVRMGAADARGSLTRDQIRRTIRQHINEVRFCYEQGLVRRPNLEGRVSVTFIVSPSGAVQSAAEQSTVNDNQVGSCVVGAVRRWSFPQSEGVTGVTYPFLMQSSSE